MNSTPNDDKRRFFRIDDHVNLSYKKVAPDEDTRSYITDNILSVFSLSAALDIMSEDADFLQQHIEKNSSEMAQYLKLLNKKVDLIGQYLILQESEVTPVNLTNINLSASGISFDVDEVFTVGDIVKVKLLLGLNKTILVACGKVVYTKESSTPRESHPTYKLALDFIDVDEQNREMLIKYVMKKQMEQIREQKKNEEEEEKKLIQEQSENSSKSEVYTE